ncbi:MAG: transglutaminase family protein [Planctomycetota bacterium]
MSIRVALHHETTYRYDRLVSLGPQIVRLRPAPHCRTKILSYSMKVTPGDHFCNWQQDPQGNYLARLVFPKQARQLAIEIDLVADMTAINPFDFFLEAYSEKFPFRYEDWLQKELAPYLHTIPLTPRLKSWIDGIDLSPELTINAITSINRNLHNAIRYEIRMEPGVQTPEETLVRGSGSCRDSAWTLVQIFRNLGLAARFASGYLIQLAPDIRTNDGPSGPEKDFTDLHAWTEVYLPGAGWVGLDPTSGLLCGEGHLPLACTPEPSSAAPITGTVDQAECEFAFSMSVQRIHEDPRSTKPYSDDQWHRIDALGTEIDEQLQRDDVRLTFGGEPTFVSMDDMEGEEWNNAAVGENKRWMSGELIKRLRQRFAPGALLHYGEGKWYPGESLPRWALSCIWRTDGQPIWHDEQWIADERRDYGFTFTQARAFATRLASHLGVDPRWTMPAYEDVYYYMWREQRLPINVVPWDPKLEDPEQRSRMTKVFQRGLNQPVGLVMPIRKQWWQSEWKWMSGPWPVRPEKLFLLPGDSTIGLRLPLDTLPFSDSPNDGTIRPRDPFASRPPLPPPTRTVRQSQPSDSPKTTKESTSPKSTSGGVVRSYELETDEQWAESQAQWRRAESADPDSVFRTAMCVEPRNGRIYIFMPPTDLLEDYLELVAAIEETATELSLPVVLEGYLPPKDHRLQIIKVTPDPGVIEVNVHPTSTWADLSKNTEILYEEARLCRLATEKFDLDGKHTGTGGGNHIVMGGATPWDSPFLRRPDLLRSMIAFWNNHPCLSYFFSSRFIGPTSQAPRSDEGRRDAIYELQTALELIPDSNQTMPPWIVDRILRNLLIDLTGNTHRAEICIDKLYSPDSPTGRLGLVELRGFEMPPHSQMSLVTQLLVRSLLASFWRKPYREELIRWDTALHDRFMLPHYQWRDLQSVLHFLQADGLDWEDAWFAPHYEFRFPFIGSVEYSGTTIGLRTAIEPWYVLGDEPGGGGTVRYVDSSIERVEVKVTGLDTSRFKVVCNGIQLPLQGTGDPDTYVAGVRYRAWSPASCLHPTVPVHSPLIIDLLDVRAGRTVGGCTYHVAHPGGRTYDTFPINALEAEGRRISRYFPFGHTPGQLVPKIPRSNPEFPCTLDLRREFTAQS